MISTTRINDELTRAVNIRYALLELYIDATIVGSANRIYKSIKDVMTLYALEKALYHAVFYEFSDTNIELLIYKIREYIGVLSYTSSINYFEYKYPSLQCPTDSGGGIIPPYIPATPGVIPSTTTEWFSQNLTPLITVDGQTTITGLNFSIDNPNIDIDTILLEVQGDDPKYTADAGADGWHMESNTLYWHHFYELKVGMQVKIRWRVE